MYCANTGPTFLLSSEIEFEADSKGASNNFVGASVNLYIAAKQTSIVIQPLQTSIPSELNSVKVEINIVRVSFVAIKNADH